MRMENKWFRSEMNPLTERLRMASELCIIYCNLINYSKISAYFEQNYQIDEYFTTFQTLIILGFSLFIASMV